MLRSRGSAVAAPPPYQGDKDFESLVDTKDDEKYYVVKNKVNRWGHQLVIVFLGLSVFLLVSRPFERLLPGKPAVTPKFLASGLAQCAEHSYIPTAAPGFHQRTKSDRFEEGTKSYLIFNGTIWTGNNNATEVIPGGKVLLENGIIKAVGGPKDDFSSLLSDDVEEIDAEGQWVVPGLVDAHSHVGVYSNPMTAGTSDGNSLKGNTNPYLRALDGFNTHDLSFERITSGGCTTSLVLPGSADAIGGQAFVFKLRKTKENTPESMLVESPFETIVNTTDQAGLGWKRNKNHWRHMKHAFGENPSRVYSATRMDTLWDFRRTYQAGKDIQLKQDNWCQVASSGDMAALNELGPYPASGLELEAIVDILRGKTKLNVHCYEAVDLTALSRLTNEFEFRVAAVHHAHEASIVPGVIRKMFGGKTGAAIFAVMSRYKHEAYMHSVHAPKILADAGVPVIMKSDGVVRARYLNFEAAQAHYFGLEGNLAMASITTVPANIMGLDHRIGYIRAGYDADVAIFQSHPLTLGATPSQVFVDGIPQLVSPALVPRPEKDQLEPPCGDFSKEIAETVASHGDPNFSPSAAVYDVVFQNVSHIYKRSEDDGSLVQMSFSAIEGENVVVVKGGEIVCEGKCEMEESFAASAHFVDLKGGSVQPGLTVIGTNLGLAEIDSEVTWMDGVNGVSSLSIPSGPVPLAFDGLQFQGKEMKIDLRAGVTSAITAPNWAGVFGGMSTYYNIGAKTKLDKGAVMNRTVALHVRLGHSGLPVSGQVSALRTALLDSTSEKSSSPMQKLFSEIALGVGTLVVHAESADQLASLVLLKGEVEKAKGSTINLVFYGASEAHLIADEIAAAKISVIINSRGHPNTFDELRVLPGVPLTNSTELSVLKAAGVLVGLGFGGQSSSMLSDAATLRFFLAFTLTDSASGDFSRSEALGLATTNLEKIFGLKTPGKSFVAVQHGDLLDIGAAKVVASGSGNGKVSLF